MSVYRAVRVGGTASSARVDDIIAQLAIPTFLRGPKRAACAEADPELFFAATGGSYLEARRICMGCPLVVECRQWAKANGERWGIWGGHYFGPKKTQQQAAESCEYRNPVVCAECGQVRQHKARGLCGSCYNRILTFEGRTLRTTIRCDGCGEQRPHYGNNMCAACNQRRRREAG